MKRGEESPGGVLEQLGCRGDSVSDTEAVTEVEIKGEFNYVVAGARALVAPGFELYGFIFSEIVRRKGLEGQNLSEAVFDPTRLSQFKLLILQHLPVTISLEVFSGQA